jgi:hypothetical protein
MRKAWQPLEAVGEAISPAAVDALRESVRNALTESDRPEMEPDTRRHLREVYDDTIRWTEQRLERQLPRWK